MTRKYYLNHTISLKLRVIDCFIMSVRTSSAGQNLGGQARVIELLNFTFEDGVGAEKGALSGVWGALDLAIGSIENIWFRSKNLLINLWDFYTKGFVCWIEKQVNHNSNIYSIIIVILGSSWLSEGKCSVITFQNPEREDANKMMISLQSVP